ncbi:MAG: hypothetical protein JWQ32_2061 [Marmoricola sp.]|nr:hypothetical protein [Marmoricola sp.]
MGEPLPEATRAHPVELDPRKNFIISAFGRKGAGKTTFNRMIYRDYPLSKLCIDVNGEAEPGEEAQKIHAPERGLPRVTNETPPANLHYVADPGSDTYRDDLDRAVGMAMYPSDQHSLIWGGEVGELCTGNMSGPHLRRLLMQSRHYKTSALFDGPRPMNIDPLVIGQSDYVVIYDLPNPADRKRVAENIAYPPARFDQECEDTFRRGPFWHLLWSTKAKQLYRCPPLPPS